MLEIADRANFNKNKKDEICDINLVFEIAKLKNDHIKFKNENFAKVGETNSSWKVKSSQECDFGKWIIEQENLGKEFTRNTIWNSLKEYHENIHKAVQEYIDENAKGSSNEILEEISKKLEDSTQKLFELMDKIKVEHCKLYTNKIDKTKDISVKQVEIPKKEKVTKEKTSFDKKVDSTYTSTNKTITANNNDDDEWESF